MRYVAPPPLQDAFAVVRFTQAFYQEVADRQAHERHCQWYATVAAQHRAEYAKLKQDLNLWRWFRF